MTETRSPAASPDALLTTALASIRKEFPDAVAVHDPAIGRALPAMQGHTPPQLIHLGGGRFAVIAAASEDTAATAARALRYAVAAFTSRRGARSPAPEARLYLPCDREGGIPEIAVPDGVGLFFIATRDSTDNSVADDSGDDGEEGKEPRETEGTGKEPERADNGGAAASTPLTTRASWAVIHTLLCSSPLPGRTPRGRALKFRKLAAEAVVSYGRTHEVIAALRDLGLVHFERKRGLLVCNPIAVLEAVFRERPLHNMAMFSITVDGWEGPPWNLVRKISAAAKKLKCEPVVSGPLVLEGEGGQRQLQGRAFQTVILYTGAPARLSRIAANAVRGIVPCGEEELIRKGPPDPHVMGDRRGLEILVLRMKKPGSIKTDGKHKVGFDVADQAQARLDTVCLGPGWWRAYLDSIRGPGNGG